jgi:hypothetical protein
MKSRIFHFLAVGALLMCFGCGRSATSKGKADAKSDLAAGKLAIETAGMPAPWRSTYARLLRERHGIEILEVAGCIVDEGTMQHINAYNGVMKAEISRRFGADTLEKTAEEAQRMHP